MPHATQMSATDTGLLVIDVQEKLLAKIPDANRLVRNVAFLVDGARLLDMPVQCTEQYPRGLGTTVPELAATLYRLLGINTNTDLRIRPFIGEAAPVAELL